MLKFIKLTKISENHLLQLLTGSKLSSQIVHTSYELVAQSPTSLPTIPFTKLPLYKSAHCYRRTELCTSTYTNSACAAMPLKMHYTEYLSEDKTYPNRHTTNCYKPNTCNDRHHTILFILRPIHLGTHKRQ